MLNTPVTSFLTQREIAISNVVVKVQIMQMQLVYNGLQGFTGEVISIIMGYLDDCMAGRLYGGLPSIIYLHRL